MQRLRISYAKGLELQYTGNLDMHRVWERTFRRAHLPLAYSQGFHPQPKIQQAAPLPLGFTSQAEMLDVWLDTDESLTSIAKKLTVTVQPGIQIKQILVVPIQSEALPNLVKAAVYEVKFDHIPSENDLTSRIDHFMANETLERERRGKKYDLRPLVESLSYESKTIPTLAMRLSSLPGATGRPEEVLEELGIDPFQVDIERTALIFRENEEN